MIQNISKQTDINNGYLSPTILRFSVIAYPIILQLILLTCCYANKLLNKRVQTNIKRMILPAHPLLSIKNQFLMFKSIFISLFHKIMVIENFFFFKCITVLQRVK